MGKKGYLQDYPHTVIQTFDGGYVLVGGGTNGVATDFHLRKLDGDGNPIWEKYYGGAGFDHANAAIQTTDGGFALAGWRGPDDVHNGSQGYGDFWVIKVDSFGKFKNQLYISGSESEAFDDITQGSKGGYVVAGSAGTFGNDIVMIVSCTSLSEMVWSKQYGGSKRERAESIIHTSDGGYVFAGYTESNDGDVSGNHGGFDAWVVKIDSVGHILWQKCFGGTKNEKAFSIINTYDGGFIFAGSCSSIDGDVLGLHANLRDSTDAWIVKLNASGSLEWQKCLGGTGNDETSCIIQTQDSGYAIIGNTTSLDGDVSGNLGQQDIWIVKLSSIGNIQWQKCFGGDGNDFGESIIQTTDGGLVATGYQHEQGIAWALKLTNALRVEKELVGGELLHLTSYPNPTSKSLTIRYDLPKIVSDVFISINDVTGRRIEERHEDGKHIGDNEATFDLSRYAEGTYYITIRAGDVSETKAVQVVK